MATTSPLPLFVACPAWSGLRFYAADEALPDGATAIDPVAVDPEVRHTGALWLAERTADLAAGRDRDHDLPAEVVR